MKCVCVAVVMLIAGRVPGQTADATWQRVECVPLDMPNEATSDIVQTVDDFETGALNWSVAVGEQHARAVAERDVAEHHGGHTSLRLDYDFVGKKEYEYVQLNGKADFAKPGLGFGFWLKLDGTPFSVRVRFTDASGEWHQIDATHTTAAEWQFVAGWLDQPSTAWSGDGNGHKDYPLKLAGICIDRPQAGFTGQGRIWIDDVAVIERRELAAKSLVVDVQGKRFGNVYTVGDAIALRAQGDGDQLRWRAMDYFGSALAQGEGAASGTEAHFTLDRPGWFACQWELLAGGRVVGLRSYACAALPDDAGTVRSDFVGVCSHYGHNAYPLETMDLMLRYGIDQFRDEIAWRGYERDKGRYVMPDFATAYLRHAAELKMHPLIIFDYNNPHYDQDGFPNSPDAIAGFTAYAVDLAQQTRGTVTLFEVWNEWVGGCGMNARPGVHDGAAYGRLLGPTYSAVKKARPDATVVGIGGEYGAHCADTIVAAVQTAGPDAMDAWSIHPYRYPHAAEASDLVGEVTASLKRSWQPA